MTKHVTSSITPRPGARRSPARTIARWTLFATGTFVLGWLSWAAMSWLRYGRGSRSAPVIGDSSRFLPAHEVEEIFQARVGAPAQLTFAVAEATSLTSSPAIRAVFRAREVLMGGNSSRPMPAGGVVDQMLSMGWGVLDASPHRGIILGAVTQPWNRDVVFRALPPEEFAAFQEAGFVKIVVTITSDPIDSVTSRLCIGTYVATTDSAARARFRRYWAVFSPGILLIRSLALKEIKVEAERRYRAFRSATLIRSAPARRAPRHLSRRSSRSRTNNAARS